MVWGLQGNVALLCTGHPGIRRGGEVWGRWGRRRGVEWRKEVGEEEGSGVEEVLGVVAEEEERSGKNGPN